VSFRPEAGSLTWAKQLLDEAAAAGGPSPVAETILRRIQAVYVPGGHFIDPRRTGRLGT
jgi:hypothetical protein